MIRDEAGALPRESAHEAGADSPETTMGAGIALIPAPP